MGSPSTSENTTDFAGLRGPDQRGLPRLTKRVFLDLAIWMVGFGIIVGTVFPFFVVAMGVPAAEVLTAPFFAATLFAGVVVGAANHLLSRFVVGSRVQLLQSRMANVEDNIRLSMYSDDPSTCTPESCSIPVDSEDELGAAAAGFNRMVEVLATSTQANLVARRFATTLASHIDLNRLAELALDDLLEIGPFEAAAVCVLHEGEPVTVASSGLVDQESIARTAPVQKALQTLEPVRLDLPGDIHVDGAVVQFSPHTVLALPLQLRFVPIGVVMLASTNRISDEAVRLIKQLLPNLAVALNNALSHERLQRVAAMDPLTGLLNRRFGLERLGEEFSRAVRGTEPLGLLLFDIDHFKRTNDTFGHQAGDQLLQAIADSARAAIRDGDTLMRYGGEEFLVVLPGAGPDDVRALGERVRHAVEATEITIGSCRISATVSVGAVAFPDTNASDIDELVNKADAAMYAAKSAGRNRLTLVS
jgi:diguanylate cyclase (GGDEF)-like protein